MTRQKLIYFRWRSFSFSRRKKTLITTQCEHDT